MRLRVCPDCGEEFRPDIVTCSDCGALLEDRFEDEATGEVVAPGAPPPATEPPPAAQVEGRGLYTSNKIREIQPLAERLGASGIPFWVVSAGDSWTVLVAEEDEERGRVLLKELFGLGHAPSEAFDPESGYAACPACGAALAARAGECPECGLAVGAVDDPGEP